MTSNKPDTTDDSLSDNTVSSGDSVTNAHGETVAFVAGASTAAGPPAACAAAFSAPSGVGAAVIPEQFGRYRIKRQLGRGGMGSVYLAEDEQLHREVALKIPHVSGVDTQKFSERLVREARAAAALRHANICPVYDVGEHNGIHYLAMAHIPGRPLTDYIQAAKKPQSERSIAITVYKITQALAEAHRHGVFHRDLKPANIMLDDKGEPMVMDFGLSQHLVEDQTRLTQEGTIIGTPAYMAPEQIDNRSPIGPATDVYSLGVVLFELLTRRCPFEGSAMSVIGQVLHAPMPDITQLRGDVSPPLAAICARAMAKDPAQRFGTMQEFGGQLLAFIKGKASAPTEIMTQLPEPQLLGPLDRPLPAMSNLTVRTPVAQSSSLSMPVVAAIGGSIGAVLVLVMALVIANWLGSKPVASATPTSTTPSFPSALPAPPVVAAPVAPITPPPATTTASILDPAPAIPATTTPSDKPAASPTPPVVEPVVKPIDESNDERPPPPPRGKRPRDDGPPPDDYDPQNDFGPPENRPPPGGPKGGPRPQDGPPGGRRGPLGPWGPQSKNERRSISELFKAADHNGDNKLDDGEMPRHIRVRADRNSDGVVDLKELREAQAKMKDRLFEEPTSTEHEKLKQFGPPPRD